MSEYPALARAARIQGTVDVKCTLDSTGNVITAEALSGPRELREAARQNALEWKFQRASNDTKENSFTLTYRFLLEGKPQYPKSDSFVFDLPNRVQMVARIFFVGGSP